MYKDIIQYLFITICKGQLCEYFVKIYHQKWLLIFSSLPCWKYNAELETLVSWYWTITIKMTLMDPFKTTHHSDLSWKQPPSPKTYAQSDLNNKLQILKKAHTCVARITTTCNVISSVKENNREWTFILHYNISWLTTSNMCLHHLNIKIWAPSFWRCT